ncbi:MAG: FtsW/RodA/SpoVE family cell cycle protein [Meiothermus sp.]|nr:FtsW/RodA/SpoVE family cell cycle protein [Meiothermus sp.]
MDPILLLSQFLLYALSALGIAASDSMPEFSGDREHLFIHLLRIGIALAVMFVVSRVRPDWVVRGARALFVLTLALLVLVLFIGEGPAGVRRWIDIPGIPFDFQPSELAKLTVVLYLAAFFHNKPTDYPVLGPIIAISVAAGLVIIEPDFDTGLFILLLAGFMLVVIGVPWRRLLAIGVAAWVIALSFSGLYLDRFQYVRDRFENWLSYQRGDFADYEQILRRIQFNQLSSVSPEERSQLLHFLQINRDIFKKIGRVDPQVSEKIDLTSTATMVASLQAHPAISQQIVQQMRDAFYQIAQGQKLMLKAGVFGQGAGATMPHRLPEGHNDMIFASIVWAGGWLAGLMVIFGFAMILARSLQIAARLQGSKSVMAVGLMGYLVLQAAINIGVVIGFLPVSGSPLPFVSYGGSAMLVSAIALGLLHALSREAFAGGEDEEAGAGRKAARGVQG